MLLHRSMAPCKGESVRGKVTGWAHIGREVHGGVHAGRRRQKDAHTFIAQ
jgi:hypothetical protein